MNANKRITEGITTLVSKHELNINYFYQVLILSENFKLNI